MKKVDNNLFLKRFSCLHMYVWANIERSSRKCILPKALTSINFLFFIILFILLGVSDPLYAQQSQNMFPLTKYSPRLELTLKGGNTRSMGRLGGVIPIVETNRGLLFSNIFGLLDSQNAQEGNVGLGYRHIFSNDYIIGGYAFYDHRRSGVGNKFNQITIGSEYLSDNFEARFNIYLPIGKREYSFTPQTVRIPNSNYVLVKRSTEQGEKILHGFDVEIGGNLPSFKPLEGYITYYHFNSSDVKPVHGVRFRTSLKLNEYISFEGEVSHDRLRKEQTGKDIVIFGGIKLNYTFGKKKEPLTRLEQKMTQMVIRDIDAITDNYKKVSDQENIYIDNEGHVYGASEVDEYVKSSKKAQEQEERKKAKRNDPKRAIEILRLDSRADFANVRKAYKRFAFKYHPDKNGQFSEEKKTKRTKKYLKVQRAFTVLKTVHEEGRWDKCFSIPSVSKLPLFSYLPPTKVAYTSIFQVVDPEVRERIQGIVIQAQGQKLRFSLVPQGLVLPCAAGMETSSRYLIDIAPIQKYLIPVEPYKVSGIPANVPEDKLDVLAKEYKWQVTGPKNRVTNVIDAYSVQGLGARGLGGGEEIGVRKISFSEVFDRGIYNQDGCVDYNETTLKKHLREKKEDAIKTYIANKIKDLGEFKILLKNSDEATQERLKLWCETSFTAAALYFTGGIAETIMYTFGLESILKMFFQENVGYKQILNELEKKLVDLKGFAHFLTNDLDKEPMLEIEMKYVCAKRNISEELQIEIENMLLASRNKKDKKLEEKKLFIERALQLPTCHKQLDLESCLKRFRKIALLENYDEITRQRWQFVVTQLQTDSDEIVANTVEELPRTVGLLHGPSGSGKTTLICNLLTEVTGLPCKRLEIGDNEALSMNHVYGCRDKWHIGWIAEALLEPNQQGERFTNGILLIDDIHNILFLKGSDKPNPVAMSFLLDFLDSKKVSASDKYFRVQLPLTRLNIFVTSNRPLPEINLDLANSNQVGVIKPFDPFRALNSRFDLNLHCPGFKKELVRNSAAKRLKNMLERCNHEEEVNEEGIVALVSYILENEEDNIDLRNFQQELKKIVTVIKIRKLQKAKGNELALTPLQDEKHQKIVSIVDKYPRNPRHLYEKLPRAFSRVSLSSVFPVSADFPSTIITLAFVGGLIFLIVKSGLFPV